MAEMDVFNSDAFRCTTQTAALEKVPYIPNWLGQQAGLFVPMPIRTRDYFIEKRDNVLSLVKTTPVGSPVPQRSRELRDARAFRTYRLAYGDRLNAEEIQGIRAMPANGVNPGRSELEQVSLKVLEKQVKLRNDCELTWENHRLGAIQGKVLDADGSLLHDWFSLWGLSVPTFTDFDLLTSTVGAEDGPIEQKCRNVIRAMQRASKGSWVPGQTYVAGLCGDDFFDALIKNRETRQTYLNWVAAENVRNRTDVNGREFSEFTYGNIRFVNYRGTDDTLTVAVQPTACYFFPVGAREVFGHVMSPGEYMDEVNTEGQAYYAGTYPDPSERNAFVDLELRSYPSFVCMRPEMLLRAKRSSADNPTA